MLSQLKQQLVYNKDNRFTVSLNDDNQLILKTKEEAGNEAKLIGKKILNRLAEEGVDPRIQGFVKSQLDYWTENGTRALNIDDMRHINQEMNTVESKFENKSYLQEIITEAKSDDLKKGLTAIGINPENDYNPESLEKYLEKLAEMGVDVIPHHKTNHSVAIIRYVNAMILADQENDILGKIDSTVKDNPGLFLAELKSLKESGLYNPYVLDKLIAQAEVWQVMQYNPKLKTFPFSEIWRFCIDIEFQKFGAYVYENEPGYMVATLNTLRYGLQLKDPTYLDYIEINKKCGENVKSSLRTNTLAGEGGPLQTHVMDGMGAQGYGIYGLATMDPEGLEDIKRDNDFFAFNARSGQIHLVPQPKSRHLQEMDFLFDYHSKKIAEAGDNIGKRLIAHIWLSRELSLQHHCRDGNGRAAQILLLSLIANDPYLPMMQLDTNPNLDTNGPVAFTKRIVQAFAHYCRTCGVEEAPLTFDDIDAMIQLSEHPQWSHYHPTEEERQAFYQAHPVEEYLTEEERKKISEDQPAKKSTSWEWDVL